MDQWIYGLMHVPLCLAIHIYNFPCIKEVIHIQANVEVFTEPHIIRVILSIFHLTNLEPQEKLPFPKSQFI